MKTLSMLCAPLFAISLSTLAFAEAIEGKRSPAEIIAATTDDEWRTVDPAQIVVFEIEQHGKLNRVTVELSDIFAPNHVAQMKTLVRAGFYDGLSFYRVIDGFVAQGGDPFEKRKLPEGLTKALGAEFDMDADASNEGRLFLTASPNYGRVSKLGYADLTGFIHGFPMGFDVGGDEINMWPLHCTGAFAFGRNTPRDSASTEFYIPLQPQRYLDRNLTVFGRVIDGMQHLQALTRQAPPETEEDPLGDIIVRAWMGDTPPEDEIMPAWQVFRTDTKTFAEYVESRRNRPEDFFYYRPNHVDICQLSIPVRSVLTADE